MTQGMAMVLIAVLNAALEGGPKVWNMLQRKKEAGEKVTMDDVSELEALWEKPGEDYFKK